MPVCAANMDTTGTFETLRAFSAHKCMVALHKHYTPKQWEEFVAKYPETLPYMVVSTGISADDQAKLATILSITKTNKICVDVANGYFLHFLAKTAVAIKFGDKKFPSTFL